MSRVVLEYKPGGKISGNMHVSTTFIFEMGFKMTRNGRTQYMNGLSIKDWIPKYLQNMGLAGRAWIC